MAKAKTTKKKAKGKTKQLPAIKKKVKTPATKKPKKKGGRVIKEKKEYILSEITKIVENGRILGVTQTDLAKKFDVRRQTISDYLKEIYASLPPEDINETRVKIQTMFDRLFKEVQVMVFTAPNATEKREAVKLLLKMIDRFTAFLESFHIKAKAVENVNLQADVDHKVEVVIVRPDYAEPKVIEVEKGE